MRGQGLKKGWSADECSAMLTVRSWLRAGSAGGVHRSKVGAYGDPGVEPSSSGPVADEPPHMLTFGECTYWCSLRTLEFAQ